MGDEAYTARKQAVKDQLRKRFIFANADAVSLAEGSTRPADKRGRLGVAGVPSSGHASKGISREPRRAPHPLPTREVPVAKGDRRRPGRVVSSLTTPYYL